MQRLRNSLSLTRLILVWFMLTVGMAVASPIVQPRAMEVVCTANGGMLLMVLDEDGQAVSNLHPSLDCPLCLVITAPPVYSPPYLEPPQPLGLALRPVVSARIAARLSASHPPRGPPSHV